MSFLLVPSVPEPDWEVSWGRTCCVGLSCTYRPVHCRYTAGSRFNRQILTVKNFRGKNILPVVVCPPLDFMRFFTVLRNALCITVQKSWNTPSNFLLQHHYNCYVLCPINSTLLQLCLSFGAAARRLFHGIKVNWFVVLVVVVLRVIVGNISCRCCSLEHQQWK